MTKFFRLFIVALAVFAAFSAKSAVPAATDSVAPRLIVRNCFTTAPTYILPLLPPQTRQDMLSYFDAGRDTPSDNATGEPCRIISLSDDHMEIASGSGISTEMFVLNPDGKFQVIGVIETIDTPVPDSRVYFFDTKWRSLEPAVAVDPEFSDWIPKAEISEMADIQREVPFVLASFHFDPATSSIVAENNMKAYYLRDNSPAVLEKLRRSLTYKWTGKNFRLVK